MPLSSVLLVLLQVCSLPLMVVAMPTCQLDQHLVKTAHNLLRDLGGQFPDHCRTFNANMSFPKSAFPAAGANHLQCRQALWAVHESLDGAWQVFENNSSPVGVGGATWDKHRLENFQNLQYQLMEQTHCFSGVGDSGVFSQYFTQVSSVVEQQDSAACGWLALKTDLLWVLKSTLHTYSTCLTRRDSPAH